MVQWTASVSGPGALAERFAPLLDVLPVAALIGDERNAVATLMFDVEAPTADVAIERAFHRAHDAIGGQPVTLTVERTSEVVGREPWWVRLLRR